MKSVAKKPQKEKKKQKQKDVIKLGSEMDPKQVCLGLASWAGCDTSLMWD